MKAKVGDKIMIKVGDIDIETTIDKNGTQRLPNNPTYNALLNSGALDLNKLARSYHSGEITFKEYLDINLNIGYSVSGFAELSSFEHLEIIDPL